MIRQKPTKTITGAYTTTDADNGYRIICSSSYNFTITLHSATGRYNFDLEIDNKGIGIVTVGGKELAKDTHAHVGNDNGIEWVVSLGGGGGSEYELPQANATTLGGIKASPKTSGETQEVKIDPATGKLYSTPPTAAQNGLPAGGTAGQIPVKNSDDDYDVVWRDVSSGSGNPTYKTILLCNLDVLFIGTNIAQVIITQPMEIIKVEVKVSTSPIGANLIVDVNKNGNTLYTTQLNRPTILAGGVSVIAENPDTISLTTGDVVSFDVDQVGSTVAGAELEISITCKVNIPQVETQTTLLMHMNGINGSATFTDELGHICAAMGATLSNTQKKFGDTSGYFNGSSYLKFGKYEDFNLGAGDFTIDLQIFPLDLNGYRCWLHLSGAKPYIFLATENGSSGYLIWWNDGNAIKSSIPMTVNAWNHVALVRKSTVVTMYLNGVNVGQTTNSGSIAYDSLAIGANSSGGQAVYGYIDEVRISKGIARWASNFNPPTEPHDLSSKLQFGFIL